jgi:DNA primase
MTKWHDLAERIVARACGNLWRPVGREALDYLRGRGFMDEWLIAFEIGFIPHYAEWRGLRIPAGISIPSRSDGLVTQIRVRNPNPKPGKPKYLSVSGGKLSQSLFGIDWIDPTKGVFVFEGELNALTCWQWKIQAIATTSANNKIKQVEHMLKLLSVPWIVSWFDRDGAGDTARANLPRCDEHIMSACDLNDLYKMDRKYGTNCAWSRLQESGAWFDCDIAPEQRQFHISDVEFIYKWAKENKESSLAGSEVVNNELVASA